jgi:putative protease
MNKIELLAPAGNFESFIAAISNGADAVYMGTERFNARKNADNFSDEEFIEAVNIAHRNKKKIYATVNTLILDSEWETIEDEIYFLQSIGVDALIIQDLGLAIAVKKAYPELNIHASTQMTIHNLEGIKYASNIGFKRIVVSREMNINDIKKAKDKTEAEIEVFAHGALCISYSGQCLMSSMLGKRSGNRGQCAQPCRKKYIPVDKNEKPISKAYYALSPKDLMTVKDIDKLYKAGVTSIKLEGRMKKPEYVAQMVKVYKKAIDSFMSNSNDLVEKEELDNLKLLFNRGFTKGFLFNEYGVKISSPDRPDNRGLLISEDIKHNSKGIMFKTNKELSLGDGITFEHLSSKTGMIIKKMYVNDQYCKETKKGDWVQLPFSGQKVFKIYKSSDPKLNKKLQESYKTIIKAPVRIDVKVKLGEKIKLLISKDNFSINYESDFIAEKAKNSGTSRERIIKQISKLGDSPYFCEKSQVEIDENVFIPIAELNKFRRECIDDFDKNFLNHIHQNSEYRKLIIDEIEKNDSAKLSSKFVSYSKNNKNLFTNENVEYYTGEIETLKQAVSDNEENIFFELPTILNDSYSFDYDIINNYIKNKQIKGVIINHFKDLEYLESNCIKIAGRGFNILNTRTAIYLKNIGFNGLWLSPELDLDQSVEIRNKVNIKSYIFGFGSLKLMTMRNCPFAVIKGCIDEKNCKKCDFAREMGLKDEKGLIFKLVRKNHLTYLFNSKLHFLIDKTEALDDLNLGICIETKFDKEEKILENYYNNNEKPVEFTRGHCDESF